MCSFRNRLFLEGLRCSGKLTGKHKSCAFMRKKKKKKKLEVYPYTFTCSTCFNVFSRGQTPADAEYNYLDKAKRLEMYGVDLHSARVRICLCVFYVWLYNDPLFSRLWITNSQTDYFSSGVEGGVGV